MEGRKDGQGDQVDVCPKSWGLDSSCIRPERPFLSALAKGLGSRRAVPSFPGPWPGLTETALQAEYRDLKLNIEPYNAPIALDVVRS